MKKITRFAILSALFVVLFLGFYSLIPFITWIFGGSFREVAQHPIHVMFAGLGILFMLGVVFNESFDEDFCSKN